MQINPNWMIYNYTYETPVIRMWRKMKTIELIDKYIVKQSEDTGYDPPSYIWTDNTGQVVRCRDCRFFKTKDCKIDISTQDVTIQRVKPDDYCSYGRRKDGDT